jgi:hypothetical protein
MRSVLSRSDTRQQPVSITLSFSRRQGRRRGILDCLCCPEGFPYGGLPGGLGLSRQGAEPPKRRCCVVLLVGSIQGA